MESSKKGETSPVSPVETATARRRCFTPDALARVLADELRLTPESPLYVAYSGGMDSHALLHAMVVSRRDLPWRITAIHIDHGLQPASVQWVTHARAVCLGLDVPFFTERVTVRDIAERGREDAARAARYEALARQLPAGGVLLTAHHQDDQAETVLLQLLRGGGVAGLAAMPAITDFALGRLARPLLGFSRDALGEYAQSQGLIWIEDTSNRDESLARNYLRHRVWPVISAHWPQAAENFALSARYQAQAAELLDQLGEIDSRVVVDVNREISISALLQLADVRQANAVRYWLRTYGLPLPHERVLEQILGHVRRCPRTQHAEVRWGSACVRRYRNRLVASRVETVTSLSWEASWNPAATLVIPGSDWRLSSHESRGVGLSRARIGNEALRVRLRRGGEQCRLRGRHHKVKKLLQEAGIPPWERGRLPFIYVGEELAAVGDRWICESFAAQPDEASLVLVLERHRAS